MELHKRALHELLCGYGDPLAGARAAAAESPNFVAAHLLEASLLAYSRDVREVEAARPVLARLRGLPMSPREARHVQALTAALAGDYSCVGDLYGLILDEEPRDLVALWAAQVVDYYLGNLQALPPRMTRVARRWSPSMPGYHAVLAMMAFGFEEIGDYETAEHAAWRALELEPRDLRAGHALLHVFEMQGRAAEGAAWVQAHENAKPLGNHLQWHHALFQMELERPDLALAIYDRRLRRETLPELIDSSALLWRLMLAGAPVGERFAALAARWAPRAEEAYCAFNDLHAMMAFAGARRFDLAERLLRAQERRLARAAGANHDMTRLVGYPAARALAAFGRGEFRQAEVLLRALPPVAHRIGGSHAQRDVLLLTRAAAAARRARPFHHGEGNAFGISQIPAAA